MFFIELTTAVSSSAAGPTPSVAALGGPDELPGVVTRTCQR